MKNLQLRYLDNVESQDSAFGIINNEKITIHCPAQEKPLVIIIKNKFMTQTLKNYFEFLWKIAKP